MSDVSGAPARFKDLALDAADHQGLADWWCAAIGYVRRQSIDGVELPDGWGVPIVDPDGGGPLVWINPVAEAKTVKNRMHPDVWGDAARLVELGATVVREPAGEVHWHVLADPEGNEFCVFARQDGEVG
ncbi:VOC family protein [Kitasatospora sp. NPDC017646]|uniref:VOC family protein n=1 Tax=Kitasatospora sp. NPDC017646 TaxID=3364024 RepID=UPI0037A9119F